MNRMTSTLLNDQERRISSVELAKKGFHLGVSCIFIVVNIIKPVTEVNSNHLNGKTGLHLDNENFALKQTNDANRCIILGNDNEGSVTSTYNYPIGNDFSVADLMKVANNIYDRQE